MTDGRVVGVAAGVPFVAVPPAGGIRTDAPAVVAWHLLDPPRTPAAFAAAVPLAGLDAWRLYLGLPLSGDRMPAGGVPEIMRLLAEDVVLNLHGPITDRAVAEFPAALAELRGRFGFRDGPVGVVGGSLGGAVAQLVLLESPMPVAAAVLVNPVVRLRTLVDVFGQRFGTPYTWSPASLAVAERLDFVARAGEFVARGRPPVLMLLGADDDPDAVHEPALRLTTDLTDRYGDAGSLVLTQVVEGMGHGLVAEPGVEPAPQTREAAEVDRHAVDFLGRCFQT